jgi:L-cysteine desulfidase
LRTNQTTQRITQKTKRQQERIKEFRENEKLINEKIKKLHKNGEDSLAVKYFKEKIKNILFIEKYSLEAKIADSAKETKELYLKKNNKIKRVLDCLSDSEFFIRKDSNEFFLLFIKLDDDNIIAFHFNKIQIKGYGNHLIEKKYKDEKRTTMKKIIDFVDNIDFSLIN